MKQHIPIVEIQLATRVGFLSKKIWFEYFAYGNKVWRNRQWNLLKQRGYFIPHPSKRASSDVLVLNLQNLCVQKLCEDKVSRSPNIAFLDHDEMVVETYLKFMNADWVKYSKFESELKRDDSRNKKLLLPDDKIKYPDLLLKFNRQKTNQALVIEIELTRKDPKRYRQILNAYMTYGECAQIVFVVSSEAITRVIQRAIRDTYFPIWEKPIGFVYIEDWQRDLFSAPIYISEKYKTISEIVKEI